MELLLLLGLVAVVALTLMAGFSYLNNRRAGTVLAVPLSARTLGARRSHTRRGRAASAHK